MEDFDRYNHLNKYLKEKFGERTLKICIDGNFTCPNRDGTKSVNGCIFCSEKGSGEHLNSSKNIKLQIEEYFNSYKSKRANKFIVYFQNYTNTYDTISNLKQKYDSALTHDKIVGLEIATRPDCINEDVCKLLKTYKKNFYVCVELGLQTSNDSIGNIINRCYSTKDFKKAVNILNNYDIDVVAHIMVGLPKESFDDIKNTIKFLSNTSIQGLKIHSTYVIKNTILEKMYNQGKYTPITLEYYLKCLEFILTHINPNIIIHRISGDAPKNLLVAPEWNSHKKLVLNGIDKLMKKNNSWQGKYYHL